jgi:serine/threonine protein kinase
MSRENYELTGQKIQGYTIAKPIGQGKFSIVYRAENEQGIPFALKKIKVFSE